MAYFLWFERHGLNVKVAGPKSSRRLDPRILVASQVPSFQPTRLQKGEDSKGQSGAGEITLFTIFLG